MRTSHLERLAASLEHVTVVDDPLFDQEFEAAFGGGAEAITTEMMVQEQTTEILLDAADGLAETVELFKSELDGEKTISQEGYARLRLCIKNATRHLPGNNDLLQPLSVSSESWNDEVSLENFTKVKEFLIRLWSAVKDAAARLWDMIKDWWDQFGKSASALEKMADQLEDRNKTSNDNSSVLPKNLAKFVNSYKGGSDIDYVRTALRLELNDNRHDKEDLIEISEAIKKIIPNVYVPYEEKAFARELPKNLLGVDAKEYDGQMGYLKTNFSEKRFLAMVDMRQALREKNTDQFRPLPKKENVVRVSNQRVEALAQALAREGIFVLTSYTSSKIFDAVSIAIGETDDVITWNDTALTALGRVKPSYSINVDDIAKIVSKEVRDAAGQFSMVHVPGGITIGTFSGDGYISIDAAKSNKKANISNRTIELFQPFETQDVKRAIDQIRAIVKIIRTSDKIYNAGQIKRENDKTIRNAESAIRQSGELTRDKIIDVRFDLEKAKLSNQIVKGALPKMIGNLANIGRELYRYSDQSLTINGR